MKSKRALAALLLTLVGCNNSGPTAPAQSVNLSGIWSGTVTFTNRACAVESAKTTVTQFGDYVSIYIATKCYGSIAFGGRLAGNGLSGMLELKCGLDSEYTRAPIVRAAATGTTDERQIHLQSAAASSNGCALPETVIELSR